MSRTSSYTPELAQTIIERLSAGETLRAICRDDGMPHDRTVRGWVIDDHEGFAAPYMRARELGAHAMFDEAIEIADDGGNDWMQRNDPNNPGWQANGEHIQRSKLRLDQRRWALSKIVPKVFGDRLDLNHSGDINTRNLTDEQLAAQLAKLRLESQVLEGGGLAGGAEPPAD